MTTSWCEWYFPRCWAISFKEPLYNTNDQHHVPCRAPETDLWFSGRCILTTFPPCTPSGENMTVLNTADWLLGCSSPPTAPGSKDYGTEVHVCESEANKSYRITLYAKGVVCYSLDLSSIWWVFLYQNCSDFSFACVVFSVRVWSC